MSEALTHAQQKAEAVTKHARDQAETLTKQTREQMEEGYEVAESIFSYTWDTIMSMSNYLWEFQPLRAYAYIYGALSTLPIGIFLTYMTATTLGTSGFTSFLWVLIQGFFTGLGLVVLVPILIGTFFVAGFCWLFYATVAGGWGLLNWGYRALWGEESGGGEWSKKREGGTTRH
jgi:hypothetical protein